MISIKTRLSVLLAVLMLMTYPLASEVRAEGDSISSVPLETLYLIHLDGGKLMYSPKKLPLPDLSSMEARDPLEVMLKTLWSDLRTHMNAKTLDQLGLKTLKESSYTVYSLGLWPVLDISIASQKKFARWIAKTAKTSKVKLNKDGMRLFYSTKYNGTDSELSVVLYRKDRVRISWYPTEFSKELSPYLMKKTPATSFSAKFKKLSAEYQLSDRNLFWVDIKGAIATLLGRGEGINASYGLTQADRVQLSPACVDEAIELSAHAQYFLSGTKATQGAQASGEDFYAVLKLSPVVAEALTALNGEQVYLPTSQGAALSLGLGMNVKGALKVASQLLSFLQARSFQCEELKRMINPQTVTQAQANLSMLPPFAQQLRGVGVALYSLSQPNEAAIILSAERAPALMEVLKSMIPQLRQLQLSAPGAPAQPVKGLPIPPAVGQVVAQLTQDAFGLGLNEKGALAVKDALEKAPSSEGLFLSMQYDLQTLLSSVKQYMDRAKQQQRALELQRARSKALAEGKEPPTELPESNSDLDDIGIKGLSLQSRFTKHGLETHSKISYPK